MEMDTLRTNENRLEKLDEYDQIDVANEVMIDRATRSGSINDSNSIHHVIPVSEQSQNKCFACRKCCETAVNPLQTEYNRLPNNATRFQKLRYSWLCPPHGKVGNLIAVTVVYSVIFGVLVTAMNADFQAPFAWECIVILILLIVCTIAGKLVKCIHLPPLLGMLVAGCMLRNIPTVKENIGERLNVHWSAALRNIALAVILVRAGLGLNPTALRKLSWVVVRLAFTPCLVECFTVAISSHLILHFPWDWAFMLGFVLAAVSPAVVVPTLLVLQSAGYGIEKGIPTLVIAASSIDDVLAITGFGVVLGITFSSGHIAWNLFKGPLEVVIGVIVGIIWGIFLWYIPHQKSRHLQASRSVLLIGGAVMAIFGSQIVKFPGSGPLATLSMSFVAAYRWRHQGWADDSSPIHVVAASLWFVFEPLLFGLIGAEVDLHAVQPDIVGLGIAVLFTGLAFRVTASYLAVFCVGLSVKEKLFIAMAWLPKATVQAAIGSVALDFARREHPSDSHIHKLATQLLTMAVLSIVITAPVGAVAITLSGPRLLERAVEAGKEGVAPEELNRDTRRGDVIMTLEEVK